MQRVVQRVVPDDVGAAALGGVDGEARDVASSSVALHRIGHIAR